MRIRSRKALRKRSSNIEDTGQNGSGIMLSVLERKMKSVLACEAATKLVFHELIVRFLPHQLPYSLSAILSYHASTAGSAAAAVIDLSRNRCVSKLRTATVRLFLVWFKKSKHARVDEEKIFPTLSWFRKSTEK